MSESTFTEPPKAPDASMGRWQRRTVIALWTVLGLVLAGVIVAKLLTRSHEPMKVLFHTPAFSLVDQEGHSLSAADLRGKVYICDFFFASCPMVCPKMTHALAELARQTSPKVNIVSFTVDPTHDMPPALKQYAASYGADGSRWHFLTGTPQQMTRVVGEMKLGFAPATERDPIIHSEKFLLVDADGNVRGVYDSASPEELRALVADATWLAESRGGRGW